MKHRVGMKTIRRTALPALILALVAGFEAKADVITDWDVQACTIVVPAAKDAPDANRMLTLVQTSVYEAVNAITRRYPASGITPEAGPGASVEAAVAAANRAVLTRLAPTQQQAIDAAYNAALAKITDKAGIDAGIAVGEKAAAAVLAFRADEGPSSAGPYRPHTTPGAYVPTTTPLCTDFGTRKPWLMSSASQFRPGPPPELSSELWARDYNEIREMGAKNSTRRTPEQTEIAQFWVATQPPIYHGIVRSLAEAPGRDIAQNARLFAAVDQAIEDALIAVFDAKYHYAFWRPVTAIRNGDDDGNDATTADPAWTPYCETPMHPEYPCAHCVVSGAVGTVLKAEFGDAPPSGLRTTSETAKGATRSWARIDDFMQEVANARIYDGVHYRNSTEVGSDIGRRVGALAVEKFMLAGAEVVGKDGAR